MPAHASSASMAPAPSAQTLAMAFPGQGAQFPGMGAALAGADHHAAAVFTQAGTHLGSDLHALLADPETIDDLEVTGLATLVCSVAAGRAAIGAGADPQVVLGHSLGEYAALVIADSLAFEDALDLVSVRARVTSAAAARTPGAMSALVGIGWDAAQELCEGAGEVWVANDNHPTQVVVSGLTGAVEQVEELARERGVRVSRLAVAGAFHCPLMAAARDELGEALAGVGIRPPSRTLVSSTTALREDDPVRIARLLLDQLVGPVRFTQAVSLSWSLGARRMVECGPRPVLAGLLRRMPDKWGIEAVSDADGLGRLSAALAA